jgi:hypothetical protein
VSCVTGLMEFRRVLLSYGLQFGICIREPVLKLELVEVFAVIQESVSRVREVVEFGRVL